jgi:hypothetical protein
MNSLPKQHIESLPAAARQDAYDKVGLVYLSRREGNVSEDEVARKARFGSAGAMHHQLSVWGFAGLLPPVEQSGKMAERPEKTPEHKARGSGQTTDLPPAANAASIFQRTIDMLSVFVERLPLRKERRQGKRFVVTYANRSWRPQSPEKITDT